MKLTFENGVVLRDLGYQPGVEIAPRRVDFNLVFPNVSARASIRGDIEADGFGWEDKETAVKPNTVEATAWIVLQPAVETITASEIRLIDFITDVGGYVDGWGFFGDTKH
jgi:hypothetical protein